VETLEGKLAFIKLKIHDAIGVTTGNAQNGLMRADKMVDDVKVGVQNMKARASMVDDG
jgi:hypothetical protein